MTKTKGKTSRRLEPSGPVAVLISDVHYSLPTLELADTSMRMAIAKANELNVPLIVAGDLHDTKANMRAECVNAMLATFSRAEFTPYVIVGNHCRINEKAPAHALGFLSHLATIVTEPLEVVVEFDGAIEQLLPYYHDPQELAAHLLTIPKGSTIIMHQGVEGTNMGDYVHDKSALPKEHFADFRVISGHYHCRQTIQTRPMPRCIGGSFKAIQAEVVLHDKGVGTFDYIGNPYTVSYGEANDPPKGFQVLYDDGSLEFVPTNLREHVVIDVRASDDALDPDAVHYSSDDLVWVKYRGTKEQITKASREGIRRLFGLGNNFRLDLIPDETPTQAPEPEAKVSSSELLDQLIESISNASDDQKERLKQLWRGL